MEFSFFHSFSTFCRLLRRPLVNTIGFLPSVNHGFNNAHLFSINMWLFRFEQWIAIDSSKFQHHINVVNAQTSNTNVANFRVPKVVYSCFAALLTVLFDFICIMFPTPCFCLIFNEKYTLLRKRYEQEQEKKKNIH